MRNIVPPVDTPAIAIPLHLEVLIETRPKTRDIIDNIRHKKKKGPVVADDASVPLRTMARKKKKKSTQAIIIDVNASPDLSFLCLGCLGSGTWGEVCIGRGFKWLEGSNNRSTFRKIGYMKIVPNYSMVLHTFGIYLFYFAYLGVSNS
ncbi:hypothetical protein [Cohnella mopanensis]|uniref:hypothetical protein n=1 Tax=Cohnella mopanensis TaxID=2911966 RepID=UPI001EF8BEE6|nr:hypothetical protein [Cohnella mopanensis]